MAAPRAERGVSALDDALPGTGADDVGTLVPVRRLLAMAALQLLRLVLLRNSRD